MTTPHRDLVRRMDRVSVFRRNVVKGNLEEFQGAAQSKISANKSKSSRERAEDLFDDFNSAEVSRTLYNYLSSCIAWRKKVENIWQDENMVEEKLLQHIDDRRLYFTLGLRNHFNHYGEVNFLIQSKGEDLIIGIGLDQGLVADLEEDSKNSEEKEKTFNYYMENKHNLDLVEETSALYEAVEKADQELLEEALDSNQ